MKFIYNDGGRAKAGYKGEAGDCVTRAIAIATGAPYQEMYNTLNQLGKQEKKTKGRSTARGGVYKKTYRKLLEELGWKWTPTMFIGKGCQVHLRADELPKGRLLVSVSRHLVAVIDGTIHDIFNPDRGGKRCVYGYYQKEI